jgi:hypothetical protein
MVDGKLAIRAALFNHRSRREDVDALVAGAVQFGNIRDAEEARRGLRACA